MNEHRRLMASRAFHQLRWHSSLTADSMTVSDFLSQSHVEKRSVFAIVTDEERSRFHTAFAREVDRFNLYPLLDRPLLALSNGELHRLLLARALMLDPKFLIVDDPFAGFDAATRRQTVELLMDLPKSGTGVLPAVSRDDDILPSTTHEIIIEGTSVTYAGIRQNMTRTSVFRTTNEKAIQNIFATGPTRKERVLEFRHVTVRQGTVTLLEDVHWTIESGERWALVGPNGAGKSTLLSLALSDNPQAYANEVIVFGRRLGPGTTIWDLKRFIGWVSPELDVHYPSRSTVFEVVCSGFYNTLGLFSAIDENQRHLATVWLQRFGLTPIAEKSLDEISNIARRLTLLARACVHQPRLLLLDEPCQGLAAEERCQFTNALDDLLAETSIALVYVCHDAQELPSSIDHVLEIANGHVTRESATSR
jgi:molybdate transport system ATP-binding protein